MSDNPLRLPLKVWPTHWAGGSNSVKMDGHNTIWLMDGDGREVCRFQTDDGRVTDATYARAAAIIAAVNERAHVEALVRAATEALAYFDEKFPGMEFGAPAKLREALRAFGEGGDGPAIPPHLNTPWLDVMKQEPAP